RRRPPPLPLPARRRPRPDRRAVTATTAVQADKAANGHWATVIGGEKTTASGKGVPFTCLMADAVLVWRFGQLASDAAGVGGYLRGMDDMVARWVLVDTRTGQQPGPPVRF